MKRKRPKVRGQDEAIEYVMRPQGWDYYFNFRVSDGSRFDRGPYSELATLSLEGELCRPEGLKYRRMKLTLSASRDLLRDKNSAPAHSVGMLSATGDALDAYIFIPTESFAELVSVVQSGKVKVASVTGTRLRYRSGIAKGVRLNTEFDPEDF